MRAGGVNNMKNYKIAVAGTGYVGLSIATLLSQHHQVTAVDIVPEKVEMINNRKSPIQDDYIEKYLAEKELNLTATLDAKAAYSDADFVVIAAPTNYDSRTQHFDTSAVEAVIKKTSGLVPLWLFRRWGGAISPAARWLPAFISPTAPRRSILPPPSFSPTA